MLKASFMKKLPDFILQIDLAVEKEEILVLSGPSGSGKTTILECLAGLQEPERGEITLDERVLFCSDKKINMPPYRRRIALIFQDYALFEHMTVRENILYGFRKRGYGEKNNRLYEILERFRISHLTGRYPSGLSGGEKQRVALARALLTEPSLLLLDEPLSALDRSMREDLRQELKELHQEWKVPFILVTHCRCEEELGSKVFRPLLFRDKMNWLAERREYDAGVGSSACYL
ncbi:MAG: ATP-binding cassette domain-containing protein [Bacillota bacterium]|nr:ATP-binding cassette domain-containing protein [Bacillota bacterium]